MENAVSTELLIMVITVVGSVIASSGFWAFFQRRADKKDNKTQMILGLGHDRLVFLCTKYIKRGYITNEEFENLHEYLYAPYQKLGGNGTVSRLIQRVDTLEIRDTLNEIDR